MWSTGWQIDPIEIANNRAVPVRKRARTMIIGKPNTDRRTPSRAGLLGTLSVLMFTGSACVDPDACSSPVPNTTTLVLTFDDGPLPADVDLAATTLSDAELLTPLTDILDTLSARDIPAVFFIEGPGDAATGDVLLAPFGDGLALIHAGGHRLGYHAFAQQQDIWAPIVASPLTGREPMRRDLDTLNAYLDQALAPVELERVEVFAPIFRQPFGGFGTSALQAAAEARSRGWTYRGFLIDIADWTDNVEADPAIVEALPVATDADHLAYTLSLIRAGARRHAERAVVDVLLHVNRFTANHLDAMIDELDRAFTAETGRAVRFAIPNCYLTQDDLAVDRTLLLDAL
jgi:peptidoglycan/xylan/chitin deacetylase (PgdA/CDA1 family)